MPEETLRVLAGDCTVRFESDAEPTREERGAVLAVVKPDDTVLVHDRDGYRPAAWLTRADAVSIRSGGDGPAIDAVDGDRRLVVTCHDGHGFTEYSVTGVGQPAGDCPACDGPLVRAPEAVECLACDGHYGIPRDATLLDEPCASCGLPTMQVQRGDAFELCVDRGCESLDDRVRDQFDGAWDCPSCGSPLRILRRGRLIAGCDAYPDCETAFAVPTGRLDGDCGVCDLPVFETSAGQRCLDTGCVGP